MSDTSFALRTTGGSEWSLEFPFILFPTRRGHDLNVSKQRTQIEGREEMLTVWSCIMCLEKRGGTGLALASFGSRAIEIANKKYMRGSKGKEWLWEEGMVVVKSAQFDF